MKRLLCVIYLLLTLPLIAQEEVGAIAHETGSAAIEATDTSSSQWQNWVFAGSALVTVVIGVVIIATNTGTFNH